MTGYCDAHNHLQDARFAGRQLGLVQAAQSAGVERWVVNGSCEEDWSDVAELAQKHPGVIASFGYHPWYLSQRTGRWKQQLEKRLEQTPGSVVGEIGIDRWILEPSSARRAGLFPELSSGSPPSISEQLEAFEWQWRLAADRQLPTSVHCLKAWGLLREKLNEWPRLSRGFLLHSYGGPIELIAEFVRLGAYFGFPGYFLHERKASQREVFRYVPSDRLLIETDAPDQLPPDSIRTHPLFDPASGQAINHPANLPAIYQQLALYLAVSTESLREQVAHNFSKLFGSMDSRA